MIYITEVSPTIKLPGLSSLTIKVEYDKRIVDVKLYHLTLEEYKRMK